MQVTKVNSGNFDSYLLRQALDACQIVTEAIDIDECAVQVRGDFTTDQLNLISVMLDMLNRITPAELVLGAEWHGVISNVITAPPTPTLGNKYIVPTGATGDWIGHVGEVAEGTGTGWTFHAANESRSFAYVQADTSAYSYRGGAWVKEVAAGGGGGGETSLFYPKLVGEKSIDLSSDITLTAGAETLISIDLGATYKKALLVGMSWVDTSKLSTDEPNYAFGAGVFTRKDAVLVTQVSSEARRMFKMGDGVLEYKGASTPVASEQFSTQNDLGVVIGWGAGSTEVFLNHREALGKKLELRRAYLDGTALKLYVYNNEVSNVVLSRYVGLTKYVFSFSSLVRQAAVAGDNTVYFYLDGLGVMKKSTDKGRTWTEQVYPAAIQGLSMDFYKYSNQIFGAFMEYTTNPVRITNDGGSTWNSASVSLSTPMLVFYNNHRGNAHRYSGRHLCYRGDNVNSVGLFMELYSLNQNYFQIKKTTDRFTSASVVFDAFTQVTGYANSNESPRAIMTEIIDANTYFIAFSFYSVTPNIGYKGQILKTVDGGANWSAVVDLLSLTSSSGVNVFYSNGMIILLLAVDSKLYMNNSVDGGSTWRFNIADYTTWPYVTLRYISSFNYLSYALAVRGSGTKTNEICVTFFDFYSSSPSLYSMYQTLSVNNGDTWSTPVELEPSRLSSMFVPCRVGANEYFGAFVAYGTGLVTNKYYVQGMTEAINLMTIFGEV